MQYIVSLPASVQTFLKSAPLKSSDSFTTASQSGTKQLLGLKVYKQWKLLWLGSKTIWYERYIPKVYSLTVIYG